MKAPVSPDEILEHFYIGMALVGILAAQAQEPNKDWVTNYALDVGRKMARKVRASEVTR